MLTVPIPVGLPVSYNNFNDRPGQNKKQKMVVSIKLRKQSYLENTDVDIIDYVYTGSQSRWLWYS